MFLGFFLFLVFFVKIYASESKGEINMTQQKIYFYSWKKKYFEFSNFSLHKIVVDGKEYATNEHYFQSVKFLDSEYQEKVRLAETPAIAKRLGGSRQHQIHSDWNSRRIEVMETCLKAKFTQHSDLKELLLSTKDAILIEDSPKDNFWGIAKKKDGSLGDNMLGKLLMELREELKFQS